jgi:transcription factor E
MQIKFLKSIVEELTTKQAVPIVDLLVDKKDVNEFLIAKKLDLTINQTRNILYKLSDFGLVSFIRKKDKRKGWYIYYWTLNIAKSLNLLEKKFKEELDQLQLQLKNRQERRYYSCKTCSIEVTEEAALLNDFVCQECTEVYELSDNKEFIYKLEKDIEKLKKELEVISKERMIEEDKVEKKKDRKNKRAETIKKTKRKKEREKRKLIKDKQSPKKAAKVKKPSDSVSKKK